MRILYHHRTLADGAEGIHIAEMVKAFEALGHQVRMAGLTAGGSPAAGWASRVKAALPRAAFEAASAAVNLQEYAAARRLIREFQPDVIYKRHARYDMGVAQAAKRSGVPLILEVNAVYSVPPYERFEPLTFRALARRFERRAFKLATAVVAVSTPLARQVESLSGVTALVVPNGVDPDRFDPATANARRIRERYGLGDAFTVGWTGVLREWHGVELLLDAVAGVDGAHLLLVGDGPARPNVEARIAALGLSGRVTITGRIPHHEMPDHIAAMDVCVVADERTGVASPMKLLEYMALGRAVVAPDMENVRDVCRAGLDSLTFEAGSRSALTAALRRLAHDPELRRRLGSEARRRAVAERSWSGIAQTVLQAVRARR